MNFFNFDIYNLILVGGGALTWLVFVLTMAKLSKFYLQFTLFKRDVDTNLVVMSTNLKSMQNSLSELIIEQRRANKLMIELIDLEKNQALGGAMLEYQETEQPQERIPINQSITLEPEGELKPMPPDIKPKFDL